MDKKLVLAVAGSGKTTYIVDSLSSNKRFLIVTYTIGNYDNLLKKIICKFGGLLPENVTLMTYFQFLFRFCYKPFLSDKVKAQGIIFQQNPNKFFAQTDYQYYLTQNQYFYSNRLSLFFEKENIVNDIKARIEKYFDEFIIDEVQDIAGRDFNFLELLMTTNTKMLFVGDYYQHTFDTSRDGNVNQNLFKDRNAYVKRFTSKGFILDTKTLINSWRCGKRICEFVSENLRISISSNRDETDAVDIIYVVDPIEIATIVNNPEITKLHYKEWYKFGPDRRNWGDTKGEDDHGDVCVMLNKKTAELHRKGKLQELAPSTRNKLYVAITRAHGNVYLIDE